MTQFLPFPKSLRAAVDAVIFQNTRLNYRPTRFIEATRVDDSRLRRVCSNMILRTNTFPWIARALETHPDLLFLEDVVAQHGAHFGLKDKVIEEAKDRVKKLNEQAGFQRFE